MEGSKGVGTISCRGDGKCDALSEGVYFGGCAGALGRKAEWLAAKAMLCEVANAKAVFMQSGLLPRRCYAKWPMPKRCYAEWLAAKAMLCEVADAKAVFCRVACCQGDAMRSGQYAKWLAAKAMLCEVVNAKAVFMQSGLLPRRCYAGWPMPKRRYAEWLVAKVILCEVADAKAVLCRVACCQSDAMRSGRC